MKIRNHERSTADGYAIQILVINGQDQKPHSQSSLSIENISRGGFRFISNNQFELEDRVHVSLHFPDGHTQEVIGRICYKDELAGNRMAYGYSILDGFYSL